jgi:NTP pyrophosphatase (non-canonical NTP hydrolase)
MARMNPLNKVSNTNGWPTPTPDGPSGSDTTPEPAGCPAGCLKSLMQKVIQWHHDRNLIEGSSDKDQVLKLLQELGELSDSVCKNKDIRDDIGDMLVVMLNICERNNLRLLDCLTVAYDDIKERRGRMENGIFIKEGD